MAAQRQRGGPGVEAALRRAEPADADGDERAGVVFTPGALTPAIGRLYARRRAQRLWIGASEGAHRGRHDQRHSRLRPVGDKFSHPGDEPTGRDGGAPRSERHRVTHAGGVPDAAAGGLHDAAAAGAVAGGRLWSEPHQDWRVRRGARGGGGPGRDRRGEEAQG